MGTYVAMIDSTTDDYISFRKYGRCFFGTRTYLTDNWSEAVRGEGLYRVEGNNLVILNDDGATDYGTIIDSPEDDGIPSIVIDSMRYIRYFNRPEAPVYASAPIVIWNPTPSPPCFDCPPPPPCPDCGPPAPPPGPMPVVSPTISTRPAEEKEPSRDFGSTRSGSGADRTTTETRNGERKPR